MAFRPTRDGVHYTHVLDLVAYAKPMRSFRLVTDDGIVPPWLLPVQVRPA